MPSPVGHGLFGLVFEPFAPNHVNTRTGAGRFLVPAILIAAANAPDLDFVPGFLVGDPNRFHHGMTHSVGAIVVFTMVAWSIARFVGAASSLRLAIVIGLAYASHLFLDLLTIDTPPSTGIPLLWPLSDASVTLPFKPLLDIQREPAPSRFVPSLFIQHNAYAVLLEFAILAPILVVLRYMTRRRRPDVNSLAARRRG